MIRKQLLIALGMAAAVAVILTIVFAVLRDRRDSRRTHRREQQGTGKWGCPGSDPGPPNVRIYSPFWLY